MLSNPYSEKPDGKSRTLSQQTVNRLKIRCTAAAQLQELDAAVRDKRDEDFSDQAGDS